MSPIRKNIIANYVGSFWTALMSVIFIPVYIKFMGIESYGLVGVFASLLALFSVLDFGLSATMTREMARLAASDPSGRQAGALARTLELIYWVIALCMGVAVVSLASPIAHHWIKPGRLDPGTVKQALMITGGVAALRWPASLYAGGLRGLDRQALLNIIQGSAATLRGLGAVVILWFVSPSIQAFFTWQMVVSGLETSCLAVALWHALPGRWSNALFSVQRLKQVWRFSAGITGISLVTLFLLQTDKIILSNMLSLELFGYYTLAWTVCGVLLRVIDPIDSAVYPSLTRLVAKKDERGLTELYHRSCQTQVVVLVPAALTLVLFGEAVLTIWSGNPKLTVETGPILSILAAGTCLNGFMHIPYLTQLAHGWTSLAFYQNVASVTALVPLMVLLTTWYGGIGAAWVWVILNAGYVLISIHIMHGRILPGVKRDWYVRDVARPTLAALVIALAGKSIMPAELPLPALAACVGATTGFAFLGAVLVTEYPRAGLLEAARTLRRRTAPKTL